MFKEDPEANPSHYVDGVSSELDPKYFDDDGRPKRTGTIWTTSSHIITAVIGSGVLSLAWAVAQLGWIAGPIAMILFSLVTLYTSSMLAECYRYGDPIYGKRSYTFVDAVRNILGGIQYKVCGTIQYLYLYGSAIGYSIAAPISMMEMKRSRCLHKSGGKDACSFSTNPYMIGFGILEIFVSQIPEFHETWWLSVIAAVMSFVYSIIGVFLVTAQVAANGTVKGTLTGGGAEIVSTTKKVWGIFQAIGNIAFAYSYSQILIEIQDTIRNPPSEVKTMKAATVLSVAVTTSFYMLCGCMGYAAFGEQAPGNLLTGFGMYNPSWVIDVANIAVIIHLVGAYQVYVQPVFAFIEKGAAKKWPQTKVEHKIFSGYNLNLFRIVWRTIFVIVTTFVAMLIPFFNDVLGFLGAVGFWPLTVFFPVEMYIVQKQIPKWSSKWIVMEIISLLCFIASAVAALGSIASIANDLKTYKAFSS
ncbi:amino acid permease 3-like isoform X1 [Vicia villosa]|uniref:amino acid permease 3-like isoform X1 n=2 Tax=Vicia villosa TaxID=3911 RepID=UPI00273A8643|nr:amino acid permease 3-like isoform X1 [Vicia villosa]